MLCCVVLTDMRSDIQEIFKATPHEKQVMMFSATLSKEIRPVCKKFMQDVSKKRILSTFHLTSTTTSKHKPLSICLLLKNLLRASKFVGRHRLRLFMLHVCSFLSILLT